MEAMTIEDEMNTYFAQLRVAEKKSVVQMIKTFLQEREAEGYITIEQYNKEIEEAEAEVERGECYSQEEAIEISKGWLHGR